MSKVWFITGTGSGIGEATARAALKAGDRVVATGRNLDKVRKALSDVASDNLAIVQLDVADEGQAQRAVHEALKAFGRTMFWSTTRATASSAISRSSAPLISRSRSQPTSTA
jgi:NAD(P)-dependent dehydrogenase (short-subunit alcohol dehydrogenase family)